jgi:hypothetical protein
MADYDCVALVNPQVYAALVVPVWLTRGILFWLLLITRCSCVIVRIITGLGHIHQKGSPVTIVMNQSSYSDFDDWPLQQPRRQSSVCSSVPNSETASLLSFPRPPTFTPTTSPPLSDTKPGNAVSNLATRLALNPSVMMYVRS